MLGGFKAENDIYRTQMNTDKKIRVKNLIMIKQHIIKIVCSLICFLSTISLPGINTAQCSEFEIDEIITAIKYEMRFRILELEDLKVQNIATHHLTIHMKITN